MRVIDKHVRFSTSNPRPNKQGTIRQTDRQTDRQKTQSFLFMRVIHIQPSPK